MFTLISFLGKFSSWLSWFVQYKQYSYAKTIIDFYKFHDFFCRRHSLTNQRWYSNLFQFMQHENFRNLIRVIFTHWKYLQSRVNTFWYCFPVIKRYVFHYLTKSAVIPRNQSSFEMLQLFDIWRYQSLVILFFSFVVILV